MSRFERKNLLKELFERKLMIFIAIIICIYAPFHVFCIYGLNTYSGSTYSYLYLAPILILQSLILGGLFIGIYSLIVGLLGITVSAKAIYCSFVNEQSSRLIIATEAISASAAYPSPSQNLYLKALIDIEIFLSTTAVLAGRNLAVTAFKILDPEINPAIQPLSTAILPRA